jgi:hypothetical protein
MRFIYRPIKPSTIIKPFAGLNRVFDLYRLVREYMPEEEAGISDMVPVDAAARFIKIFSKRYFPISGSVYSDQSNLLGSLTETIPLEWKGMKTYGYEEFYNMSYSQLLAEAILEIPPHTNVSRAPVLNNFIKKIHIPQEDLEKLIPEKGFTLQEVENVLKDSPYPDLALWCRWINRRTGNSWLDTAKYDSRVFWNRKHVNRLAKQYQAYVELDKRMKDFEKWLTGSLQPHSLEVINYISNKLNKRLIKVIGEENDN